jgi:hypothetical protein
MKKLNWNFIKSCLAFRRQQKKLEALGYRMHETDWEIIRGGRYNEVIVDAKISVCGKYVYTLLGNKNGPFKRP